MKSASISCFVLAAVACLGTSTCGEGQAQQRGAPSKIQGDVLGFRTIHDPVGKWESYPTAKRWTGRLSESIVWEQITAIRVLYQRIHIRDESDVDDLIRRGISAALLVDALPADSGVDSKRGAMLLLQAVLELKAGNAALVSIGGTRNPHKYPLWLVVEHDRGVGLALRKND